MSLPSAESLRYFALPDTVKPKRQQSCYSCTATSLSYAYEVLGVKERPSTIHKDMDIGTEGANWFDVIQDAYERGFGVAFYRDKTFEDLLDIEIVTGSPVLVMWKSPRERDDLPDLHMSVVQAINEVEIVLMDPGFGDFFPMDREAFEACWRDTEGKKSFLVIEP